MKTPQSNIDSIKKKSTRSIIKSTSALLIIVAFLSACGMSQEEKTKIIEEAASLRAKTFCEADTMLGALDAYEMGLNSLSAGLKDQGIDNEGYNQAVDLFDKKIKESCPDKYPK